MNPHPILTRCAAAAVPLLLTAASANAQLVRDGDVVLREIVLNDAQLTQPAGGEFAGSYDDALHHLTLTGDVTLAVRANEPDQFGYFAYVAFEPVGPTPLELRVEVAVDAAVQSDGEIVIEPPGVSDYYAATRVSVMERGAFDPAAPDYDVLGPLVGYGEDFRLLEGNEVQFFDDFGDDPIVLEPGKAYVVTLWQEAGTMSAPVNAGDRTLSLMTGGISGYAGVTAKLNVTPVPEPALATALCAAGALFLRRRR